MARSNNKMVKRELAENVGETELRRWEVKDLVPLLMDQKEKIKKQAAALTIELEPTVDILAESADLVGPGVLRVGFAAESERLLEHARGKLERKRLDLIVANDITLPGSGFAADDNKAVLIGRDGLLVDLPSMPKRELADALLDQLAALRARPAGA